MWPRVLHFVTVLPPLWAACLLPQPVGKRDHLGAGSRGSRQNRSEELGSCEDSSSKEKIRINGLIGVGKQGDVANLALV